MQIAFIAPKSMAKYTIAGDFHFIIPQNATGFYRMSRNFKMLDNGAFEGKAIPFEDLIALAEHLRVDEIVIPDVIKDSKRTLQNIYRYIKDVPDTFKVAVVPQGSTISEFIDCFNEVSRMEGINTICFPKWLGTARPAVIHYLRQRNMMTYKFDYHLLGLDDPTELFMYKGLGIRSVDTSMPFTYANQYKRIKLFEPLKLPRIDMNAKAFSDAKMRVLDSNFEILKGIVKNL